MNNEGDDRFYCRNIKIHTTTFGWLEPDMEVLHYTLLLVESTVCLPIAEPSDSVGRLLVFQCTNPTYLEDISKKG